MSTIALVCRVLIATRGGFWRDEALSLFIVKLPSWQAMLDFLRYHESHPPLYYALMRIWISVFGDSDARSVVLPIAFGVALVVVTYLVGKSLFSTRIGLLAATFVALSPALIEYSAVARPYSVLPVLCLVSTWSLIRGLEGGGIRTWTAHAMSTAALLYTHNWGWFIALGQWVAVLVITLFVRPRLGAGILERWVLAQGAIALAYLPWVPTLLYQLRHAGHPPSLLHLQYGFAASLGTSARELLEATLVGYSPLDSRSTHSGMQLFFALPLLLITADQYLRTRSSARGGAAANAMNAQLSLKSDKRIALACLLLVPAIAWLGALILSRTSNVMLPRCLVMLAPLLLLALAYLVDYQRQGTNALLNRAVVGSIVLTFATSIYFISRTTKSNARELASTVAGQTRPSDLVVVAPEWIASSFNRYYAPGVEQIDYPHIGREGAVDFSRMLQRLEDDGAATRAQQQISEARRAGNRVWLVADRDKLLNLSQTDIRELMTSGNYLLVATARTAQIRALLDSSYGPADTTVFAQDATPRYENIRALLYAPRENGK